MVRISITLPAFASAEPPVELDAHYVHQDGQLVATPMRSEALRPAQERCLMLHSRLAFVVPRGSRSTLPLDITHADPEMPFALDLQGLRVPESGDPVPVFHRCIRPGDSLSLAIDTADVLVIRETPWSHANAR